MTTLKLAKAAARSVPLYTCDAGQWSAGPSVLSGAQRRWLQAAGFNGQPDQCVLLPAEDGSVSAAWLGVAASGAHPFALSHAAKTLPEGAYHPAEDSPTPVAAEAAAHSWLLGSYRFDRYRKAMQAAVKTRARASVSGKAVLHLPDSAAARRGRALAEAALLARDLVNTPAEDLGPAELSAAVQAVAKAHKARVRETVGPALLKAGFPAIHAVGRAAERPPRLIELDWGPKKAPLVVLVGKGVCFDSGGLDLKPADSMRWMKKDMGGAANALALAQLIMGLKLPVRLKLLIPAVENAVAGNAFRPGDIVPTRAGLSVEIGNTDAEGRVILCDALAYGAEQEPALMIDLATLTGAARVALGPQVPALFGRDLAEARALMDLGLACHDPLWHLPLWADYHRQIECEWADLVNTGGPKGGAITAALFLADFVPDSVPWFHIDLYAWNDHPRPGRPVGGEAQSVRALLGWLEQRFGAGTA